MYLWRFSIAITLGLIWYFSDWGCTVTEYFLGFLFCFTTPLLLRNTGRERSTQTDEEPEEKKTLLESLSEPLLDVPDGASSSQESQYPQVKGSLQQVFKCAYARLVLPWYLVPEPCENQPLHQVLSREIDFVIDRIIDRAKDFDVCQAVVGSIRVVTQHLHNSKQSRAILFNSQAEEIAVLREFSDALVRNLFPETFWGQKVHRCVFNEIIAVKGLGLLVTWLSDPDNLNLLVVSQLDRVTPKGSVDDSSGSDPEQTSLTSQDGEGDVELDGAGSQVSLEQAGLESNNSIKDKKRDKLRKGWNKFMDKMKYKRAKKKKMKGMEQDLMWRIMNIQGDVSNEEDVSSQESSVRSQQDSDREEDSDLENYLTSVQEEMMEFKLSYEMWRVGHWTVSIPRADWENEELFFTVHLEEKDSPENLQWDIRKSYMDVVYFCNRWQDSSSILNLEENEVNDDNKEKARLLVENFLQELVSDNLRGPTQPVFQFLCPLDKLLNEDVNSGDVWSILSGLAYILTPGQEEDEMGSPQNESPKEVKVPFPKEESLPPDSPGTAPENGNNITGPTLPTIIISSCETPGKADKEDEAENEPLPTATSGQDKAEDSDIPPASHFKMLFRGLSRSQESLSQAKITDDEEQSQSDCSENGGSQVKTTQPLICTRSNKKEKICFRVSGGANKAKQATLPRGEESPVLKGQTKWEQLETTKVIFDLLKEISGNSFLINIFDAILKPFTPIVKKKVNSFLNKMNPSEAQIASYVNTLCAKLWPESPVAPAAPRTDEEKNQTRERAHNLINAKYSNVLILKKTVMESVFNIFQDRDANKTLVYMLLSFLLKELLPNENCLNVSATALQKVTNN